ncbi:MAG: peptidoglycan DD-metalloendopeptidase family protein [Gammaproteobacteria bacterium]|nr:MAG: LysM peptidoglycan-binding domain-containing protein [Gammaproteobacteria bacterium]UCH40010.1 MAG: peptidoglycan DD-metalloendopeptidase family protein [Gammaproteobacteria bacterium]
MAAITISACAPFQPYPENTSDGYYIVQPGDNMHSIAFLLETTPRQLQRANPWANSGTLQPGMRLSVPRQLPNHDLATLEPDNLGQPRSAPEDIQLRSAEFVWPLRHFEVSSHFGNRRGRLHSGIDLRAPRGTPIHAAADGRVKFSGHKNGYGRMIVIDHGKGIETAYAHNERNLVARGQRVSQGQVIARIGRSGNATGYHLHFEFRRYGQALDPIHRMQAAL